MELIVVAVIFFIIKMIKKSYDETNAANNKNEGNQGSKPTSSQGSRPASSQTPRPTSSQSFGTSTSQKRQYWEATMENVEKAKQRAQEREENEYFKESSMHRQQENREAMQQVHASRMEAKNTTILQRAQANAEEDRIDVTLHTMEAEHNHSERVSAANHHHPEDVIPESMLGNIDDLMIKGYEGNLCFERDFLGEGMDMISRFTVPSEVPDFSAENKADAV